MHAQVCLSLLGTWSGEVWDPAKSSIWQGLFAFPLSLRVAIAWPTRQTIQHAMYRGRLSVAVLMSIFGLIFVAEPYSPD